jgi:hypothetical protein
MHGIAIAHTRSQARPELFPALEAASFIHTHKAPVPEPIEEPLPGEHPVPQEDPVPSPNPESGHPGP